MNKKIKFVIFAGMIAAISFSRLFAEEAEMKLNSNDGSSAFIVQDSAAQTVHKIDSDGNVIVQGTMTITSTGNKYGLTVSSGTLLATQGGNVGIGTNNPQSRLEVYTSAFNSTLLRLSGDYSSGNDYQQLAFVRISDNNPVTSFRSFFEGAGKYGLDIYTSGASLLGTQAIRITGDGNVGIGEVSPAATLDVKTGAGNIYSVKVSRNDGTGLMVVQQNGNVGIGTTSPAYTLDVIGDIRATGSVYYGGTSGNADGSAYTKPDYVFEDGYKVMKTEEVERFLKKEGHLPWLTSVKQEKKENGQVVDMTRMSFETVETTENLQLQLIELSKMVREQRQTITTLEQKIKELEK